ncbi:heavy metal translocating P-type ATPase [Veillonella sp. CAG:933]|uniref:heavy metal translocating P-type ATPase n=1 Tax=Veillonella sp. CAG:933 TaxID=1262980 RepID=UPI0003410F80|nr:heavy metal translocating P-type ATPase [Veillonella sp. CAG:933]CCX54045.1 cadmium-exporting ATPase [Veillonella sp. CAG:933]
MERILLLKNLTCANCAAKIEDKIKKMETVSAASFSVGTQQLRITSTVPDTNDLITEIQGVCDSIEDGVEVQLYERKAKGAHDHHDHDHAHGGGLVSIIIGVVVMLVYAFVDGIPEDIAFGVLLATYLLLGWGVLWNAIKNIGSGQVFDENFLMSVATLGAVIIGEMPEAVGVMLFYRIGTYFEEKATARSRSAIMDAIDMRPEQVRLVDEAGQSKVVSPEEVRIGQTIEVIAGERIPLDGTVIEGTTRIDTAPVTGEPVPVQVKPGSEILSGCINQSGRILMRVDKELKDSMVTRVLDAVENAAATKPRIDRFITRFARVYTLIVVVLAILVAVIPSLITGNWNYWVYTALTFLVISCPCALVLSVPLAFFSGIGRGSRTGILFKGGLSMEALRNIKAIAMDKTGTLTTGEFAVQSITTAEGFDEADVLAKAAALEVRSTHPVAVSIANEAKKRNVQLAEVVDLEELSGRGMTGVVNGVKVAVGNRRLFNELQITGYGEPADYGSEVLVALDGQYAGTILIADALKEDTKSAVAELAKRGLRTIMLTGDTQAGARYMAKEAGIDDVRAELLPVDKLSIMKELRETYGSTMFVGDGINDAPVLAGADVGGAMGSGADAAIEAADVVYMRPSISAVVESIRISSNTIFIAWQNVVVALGVKILVMIMGLFGFANMWVAVFADTGVSILCILNSIRILYKK